MENFLPFNILEGSTSDDGMFYCKLCGEIFDDNKELLSHRCPKLKERLKEISKDKACLKKQNLQIRTSQRIKGKKSKLQQQANTYVNKDNGALSDVASTNSETSAENVKSAAWLISSFSDQGNNHENLVSNRHSSRMQINKNTRKKKKMFNHNSDCYKESEESNTDDKKSSDEFDQVLEGALNAKTIVQSKSASRESLKRRYGIDQDEAEKKMKNKLSKNEKSKSFVTKSYDQILLGNKVNKNTVSNKEQSNHSPQEESVSHRDNIGIIKVRYALTAEGENLVKSAKLTDDRRERSTNLMDNQKVKERKVFLTRKSKLCDKCGYHVPEDHDCVQINIVEDPKNKQNTNSTGLSGNINFTGLSGNLNSTGLCGNLASKCNGQNEIRYEKSSAESGVEEFNCIQCGQTFFQSSALVYDNSEVFIISKYSYSIFRCEKCVLLLTFRDKIVQKCTTFNLEDFTPLICRTDNKFGCRICNGNLTGFSQIDQLAHLLHHAENFRKQCVICEHPLQSSRALRLHMKKHRVLINLTNFFRRVVPCSQLNPSDYDSNEITYKVHSSNVTRGQKVQLSNQTVASKWEPQIMNDNTIKLSRVNIVLNEAINTNMNDINRKRKQNFEDGESSEIKRGKPSPIVNSEHGQIASMGDEKDMIIHISGRDVVDYFQQDKNMTEFLDLTEINEEHLDIINNREYLKHVPNSESSNTLGENYVNGCNPGSGLHLVSVLPNQGSLSSSMGENSVSSSGGQHIYSPEISHLSSSVTSMADIHVQNDVNMVQSNTCNLNQTFSSSLVDCNKSVNVNNFQQQIYVSTSGQVSNDTRFFAQKTGTAESYGNKQVQNVIHVAKLPHVLELNGVPKSASYVSHLIGQVISSSESSSIHSDDMLNQHIQPSSTNQLSNILKEINGHSETSDVPCSMTFPYQLSGEPVQSASCHLSSYFEDVPGQLTQYSTRKVPEGITTNNSSQVSTSVMCPKSQLNQADMPVQHDMHTGQLSNSGNVDVSRSTPVSIPATFSCQLDEYSEESQVSVDISGGDDMSLSQVQSSMTSFKIHVPDNLTEEEELPFLASLNPDYTPFQICSDESKSSDEKEAEAIEPEETVANTIASPIKENIKIVGNFDLTSNVENCAFVQEVEVASELVNKKARLRKRLPILNRDNSGQFQCDMCTLCFKKIDLLFKHQELHQKNPYTCWQCFIKFTSPEKYKSHMTEKHT